MTAHRELTSLFEIRNLANYKWQKVLSTRGKRKLVHENHIYFPPEATVIANCFEDTYVGRPGRRGRRPTNVPIDLWNVYQRTIDTQHRPHNAVEGWQRGFQATCATIFPNIYRFIEALRTQQGLHNFEITQLIAGQPGNPPNTTYAAIGAGAWCCTLLLRILFICVPQVHTV